jgi:hypothetical protein
VWEAGSGYKIEEEEVSRVGSVGSEISSGKAVKEDSDKGG